jgi:hypothetical protein
MHRRLRSQGDSGANYILTSGHCGDRTGWYTGYASQSGQQALGNSYIVEDSSLVDAQIIRLPTSVALRGWQYKRVNGQPDSVDSNSSYYPIQSLGYALENTRVCVQGKTTGGHCGHVSSTSASHGGTPTVEVKMSHCVDSGDSGAGWFGSNRAYGIHKGHSDSTPWSSDCGAHYVRWASIVTHLTPDISLVTE